MPSFKCADMGMDCSWSTKDKKMDGLMKKIADHAKSAHGIEEMDDDMMQKLQSVIKK